MNRTVLLLLIGCVGHGLMAQTNNLNVYNEQKDGSIFIYADNAELYPQSVKLELNIEGLKPKDEVPEFIIVPPGSEGFVLTELVIPLRRSWSYDYRYIYFMGDVNSKHDDDFIYRLPFSTGDSYRVGQGYLGQQSHAGSYALDFNMEESTKVVAARDGLVVTIKQDSNQGCPGKRCADLGNYVRILHADGTFAEYYHLQQNGALVAKGDEVKAGDEIALSGNTGWSSGPHLHFIVFRREETRRVSFPTWFKTAKSARTRIEEKKTYKAVDLKN